MVLCLIVLIHAIWSHSMQVGFVSQHHHHCSESSGEEKEVGIVGSNLTLKRKTVFLEFLEETR